MRYFFLFGALFLVCNHIYGEAPFKINGMIDNANGDTVFFSYWRCEKYNSAITDTITVTNGTFSIEGILSPRSQASLSIKDILIRKKDSIDNLIKNVRINFISSHPASHYRMSFLRFFLRNRSSDMLTQIWRTFIARSVSDEAIQKAKSSLQAERSNL